MLQGIIDDKKLIQWWVQIRTNRTNNKLTPEICNENIINVAFFFLKEQLKKKSQHFSQVELTNFY